jgi:surface antigen
VPVTSSFDLPNPVWDEATVPRAFFDQPVSQCVPFARKVSGIDIYGDAVTWWGQAEGRYPKSYVPLEGAVLVLRGYNDPGRGHVAVVKHILSDRMIRVDHANWLNSGETSYDVPVIDVSVANDWSEVRVWHIPKGHWGGRVYVSDGFIHPIANPPPAVS